MEMAKTNLASMSVDALLKLREDIGTVLSRKADQLKDQLSRLGHEIGSRKRIGRSSLKGRKVAIKYRDRSGNTWAGRGAQPVFVAARETESWREARRFCCSKDRRFPQGFPDEIQEAT
jgi:DNA-binding protein H-NS